MTDKTGNILPETAVDYGIVHPIEGSLRSCSRAGIQIQIFVQIVGPSISVQVTYESTVKAAVCLAMSKTNCKIKDFYVQCESRLLDLDKSLVAENIVCDSTIKVLSRMRGGSDNISRIMAVSMSFVSFDDWMKSLPAKMLYEERIVPMNLIGNSTKIKPGRSQKGSEYLLLKLGIETFHKLFEMIALNHDRSKCLNGKFTRDEIRYIPETDSCIIDPKHLASNAKRLTSDGYREDLKTLAKVFRRVCLLKFEVSQGVVICPAYVDNFLSIMESMPKGAEKSDAFKMFMRNHPCMMSPSGRYGLILKVHGYTKFQPKDLQHSTGSKLGRYTSWRSRARSTLAFQGVYNFGRGAYSDTEMSWFDFCRNFLSHPNENQSPDFTIEDADLALSYHFGEHLADYLCRLTCVHQFDGPHNFADIFGRD